MRNPEAHRRTRFRALPSVLTNVGRPALPRNGLRDRWVRRPRRRILCATEGDPLVAGSIPSGPMLVARDLANFALAGAPPMCRNRCRYPPFHEKGHRVDIDWSRSLALPWSFVRSHFSSGRSHREAGNRSFNRHRDPRRSHTGGRSSHSRQGGITPHPTWAGRAGLTNQPTTTPTAPTDATTSCRGGNVKEIPGRSSGGFSG